MFRKNHILDIYGNYKKNISKIELENGDIFEGELDDKRILNSVGIYYFHYGDVYAGEFS